MKKYRIYCLEKELIYEYFGIGKSGKTPNISRNVQGNHYPKKVDTRRCLIYLRKKTFLCVKCAKINVDTWLGLSWVPVFIMKATTRISLLFLFTTFITLK